MSGNVIGLLAIAAVCAVMIALLIVGKRYGYAAIFGVLGIVSLVAAVYGNNTDNSRERHDRQATSEIEAREHVTVVNVSTDNLTVRFRRDGKVCDGVLLHYNGHYLLAENPTCASLHN